MSWTAYLIRKRAQFLGNHHWGCTTRFSSWFYFVQCIHKLYNYSTLLNKHTLQIMQITTLFLLHTQRGLTHSHKLIHWKFLLWWVCDMEQIICACWAKNLELFARDIENNQGPQYFQGWPASTFQILACYIFVSGVKDWDPNRNN